MSAAVRHLTLYPDVNALLEVLLSGVQTILGEQFVGLYLHGSLASGGFDSCSDIDFVVVAADTIPHEMLLDLKAMHARIAAGDSMWATELEGSYIARQALRRYDPTRALFPRIERGGTMCMEQHGSDWIIQLYVLREQGIVIVGPPPQTLIDPIQPSELRLAVLATLREWWMPMLDDATRLLSRGYQSYTVLTMCRILYTLQHGIIASKPVAAQWVQTTLGEPWIPLIERALAGRRDPKSKAQPDDVNGTLDLIRYTLELGQQFAVAADEP